MSALRDELAQVVRKSAPILGEAISSMNPAANIAISIISQIFGANKNDLHDIINRINSDIESDIKLKTIECDHKEALKNISFNDVENARNREIEITKLTGKRDYTTEIIATMITIGFFIICGLIVYSQNSFQDKFFIITPLITSFLIVVHYYF